jgi:hypothetical protein
VIVLAAVFCLIVLLLAGGLLLLEGAVRLLPWVLAAVGWALEIASWLASAAIAAARAPSTGVALGRDAVRLIKA